MGFNLIKSPPEVLVLVPIFSIVQFAFPFAVAFFLSKRDFSGAAVSFGSSASSLLDSADRFKGLSLSAEDMADEVSPASLHVFQGHGITATQNGINFIIENRLS